MERMDLNESTTYIRKALKKKFPNQKFSVTSQRYAGGSTVNVRWTDGIAKKPVVDFAEGFRGRTFDGIDDSTRYLNNGFGNGFIEFSRTISDVHMKMRAAKIAHEHGLDVEINNDTMQTYYKELGGDNLGMMARIQLINEDLATVGGKKVEKPKKLYPRREIVPIVKQIDKKGGTRYYTYFNMSKSAISKANVEILVEEGRAKFINLR